MQIKNIAHIIESIYYNGRVKAGSIRMDKRDFQQMARAAHGSILRNVYMQLRANGDGGEILYFGDMMDTKPVEVQGTDDARYLEVDPSLMNIPYGLGIMEVVPVDTDGGCTQPFIKMQSGTDWLYCETDIDIPFYIRTGKKLKLYGNPCVKVKDNVDVTGFYLSDDFDIAEDIVWDIINAVLGPVLKVAGWPIDMSNDNNPNVTALKEKITQAQG